MSSARIRFFGSYADILRVPGSAQFVVAGWLGRILRSTSGIATILLVAGQTGRFALAGAVAGAIVLGIAVGGPVWSRAVDARGQRLIVPFSLAATVVAAAALVTTVMLDAPVATWFVSAFALGAASIDMGSLVRARWRYLLTSPAEQHTSLALESVSDELVFVVGPPIVTLIAATAGTAVGLAAGVAASLVGGVWLWSQKKTAPVPRRLRAESASGSAPSTTAESAAPSTAESRPPRRRRVSLPSGVAPLLPIYLAVGVVFASIDVGAVSISREAGQTWLAGVILAVFAVGSVVAGFAFGPLSAHWAPRTRVLASTLAYAVVVPSLLLFHTPAVLASLIFVAGLVTTPVLISGTSLIASRVDETRLTEALTWPSIGLSLGVTVGGAVTGLAIDSGTAFTAFVVSACAAAAVGMFGLMHAAIGRNRASGVVAVESSAAAGDAAVTTTG